MALWNGLALCINGFMETALFRIRMYFFLQENKFQIFLARFPYNGNHIARELCL